MSTQSQKVDDSVQRTLSQIADSVPRTVNQVTDILCFVQYLPDILGQFGMGYSGCIIRQRRDSVLMSIKVVDSGTPLVGFITSHTTTGCVEQMFDLLYNDRLRWQKDKYPWI